MAAYAALISLENIIHTLQLHPHPPISLPEQQRLLLTQKVTLLQEFLQGYNLHDLAYTNEADPLEVRIADAAYAAEDAIETHIVDEITNDGEKMSWNRFKNMVNSFFKSCYSCTSPSRVPEMSWDALCQALDKVIQDMALIEKEAIEIKETTVGVQHQLPRKSTPSDSWRSSSIARNSSMVGVDEVKFQLKDKLCSDRSDLQIIPIVGMGGSGKTTLAINIYQDRLIKERFDICGWATISQQYSIRDILMQVLHQLNPNVDQHSGEGVLGEMLYKQLFGRRYLIIMDDMWSIDAWDRVRNSFPNNDNGSRIVVTTRLSNLASELAGSDRFDMGFLDEADSWDLLSKTVFGEESCCPLELEEIGKKIGKSCRGLPLSIVVVGGFLAKSNHTIQFWGYVEENLNSIVSLEDDERCLKVINMSYKQLPIYLKPCFLYTGVYREDKEIRVSQLIKVLGAEGFVKPRNGLSLEETAKEYLKDLIDRNLILVDELGSTGKIKYCKIHDVVREFCLREARKERFYYEVRQNTPRGIINGQRRIVINCWCAVEEEEMVEEDEEMVDSLQPMPLVRSCILDDGAKVSSLDFRLLRVLHARRADPTNSGNMTQLVNSRYLAMRMGYHYPSISSSICRFWNLQTLIIGCFENIRLPAEIWCMTQIRHIKVLNEYFKLPDAPASGEEDEMVLGNLQTLARIKNFKLSEEVVKRIPNLRKLGIRYTDIAEREYSLSNLACLHKLESLELRGLKPSGDDEWVVNLPPSLKKLTIETGLFKCWQNFREEMGNLPLLEKLVLDLRYSGEEFRELETVEGTFPRLKFLGIHFAHALEIWRIESSSHFPCLERLHLSYVKKLKEVPSELAEIATLGRIDVEWCSKSVGESTKRLVEIQEELYGESALQVRVYPHLE